MKVIDTTQAWFQALPSHQIEHLEGVEASALVAKESGILFYTADVESWSYGRDSALTIITQVGWELVSPVRESNGRLVFLFKKPA